MQTCQVQGHHDKTARTKTLTQNSTKHTQKTRRNRHSEKIFCVFRNFQFLFIIYDFLNEFSKKC